MRKSEKTIRAAAQRWAAEYTKRHPEADVEVIVPGWGGYDAYLRVGLPKDLADEDSLDLSHEMAELTWEYYQLTGVMMTAVRVYKEAVSNG